jgi:glycosyltransferase involved in cell wall biosynthesis
MNEMSHRAPDRIAIVAHTHPSLTKGGAEIAAYGLYTGLLRLGLDALFITACPQDDAARLVLGSAREKAIYYAPQRYEPFYNLSPGPVIAQLRSILEAERITIVNFHHFLNIGINTIRAAASKRARTVVVTLHEYLAICHHHGQMVTRPDRHLCESSEPGRCNACFPEFSRQQFIRRRLLMLDALAQGSGVISPSAFLADRMERWGLPRERIEVVENGLFFEATKPQARAVPGDEKFVFGYFGQLTPFKGVDVLLDAAEIVARTPVLAERVKIRIHGNIVGQTSDFVSRLQNLVKGLPILDYAGAYDNERVIELMQECHYIVVPSTWWENSPLVIQEAYAAGCPVICAGIGGMQEKVRDGEAGLHFRRGDGADLARTIEHAMDAGVLARLRTGLPEPRDCLTMAEDYVTTFARFTRLRAATRARRNLAPAAESLHDLDQ